MTREIILLRDEVTLVDDEDYPALNRYRWRLNGQGYVVRWGYNRLGGMVEIRMHRQILDAPRARGVDHIDGDKRNNTRANLRLATQQQNLRNRGLFRNNRAKIKGVSRQHDRWHARLQFDGTLIHLGFYATQEQAALAYDAAARLLFGPFARFNLDEDTYCNHPDVDWIEDRVEACVFARLAEPCLQEWEAQRQRTAVGT